MGIQEQKMETIEINEKWGAKRGSSNSERNKENGILLSTTGRETYKEEEKKKGIYKKEREMTLKSVLETGVKDKMEGEKIYSWEGKKN